MKRREVLMFLLLGVFIISCAPVEEGPKTSGEVMKVAKYYWPGTYWIEIANEKGWFDEAGLNVELVDTNEYYYQSLQDTVDGKIDTTAFPYFDFVKSNLEGAELIAVINTDLSSGAEAIVAKEGINSVSDLQGKRIGVSSGYYTDYILDVVLEKYGISENDVSQVEITEDQNDEKAPEEFVSDSFDAVITWEPIASNVVDKGGHYIWDSSKIININGGVQLFKKSFIDQRPYDVQAYVNVWHKTTEFIKEHPEEAFQIIADIYDVTPGEAQAFTQLDKILDLEENKIAFSYSAGFESLHGTARQINDFMIENGITDKQLDSTDFIDARFIRGVEE